MRDCRDRKRNKRKKLSFNEWRGTIDEITLTDPANHRAGHSAPTPAAKRAARDAKRARAAKRAARRALAAAARAAMYRRLNKRPPK